MAYQNISPALFKERLDTGDYTLIDVRSKQEYVEGKIEGHTLIDFRAPDFPDQIQALDKQQNYLVYCRSGNRSGQACQMMDQMGFTGEIYNLEGGITAWNLTFGAL